MSDNEILSVGIDIGTSTTQVIFSRIAMKNTRGYFTVPRVAIVNLKVIYKSPVYFTPLVNDFLIDSDAVREIVAKEYSSAGFRPEDVQSGAVIITGESAKKENAAQILKKLSDYAGDFVVSTAGPDLESLIAGKGSGAYQYSLENYAVTANLDIGGGTTNVVVFDHGTAAARGCFDIGGRLIRIGPDGNITYISSSVEQIAGDIGVKLQVGDRADERILSRVTDRMAELLSEAMGIANRRDPLLKEVTTRGSSPLTLNAMKIDSICFSGGVADCINYDGKDSYPFGDIGVLLARSIRNSRLYQEFTVIRGRETIRATVVGAGTYTTTISGSTITYADEVFPIKNVPTLKLSENEQGRCLQGDAAFLREKISWFLEQHDTDFMILALRGFPDPDYEQLSSLANCLVEGMDAALPAGKPLLVVLEQDIAKALGMIMEKKLKNRRRIVCIDGIHVEDGDYVDMGRPVMNGMVVPVVVKTLLFG
jgi:ethanolamine utilization protein EutA